MRSLIRRAWTASCLLALILAAPASAETLARYGAGWLESVDGYLVLHLKGTHREMGLQHGKLLADHIRENMNYLLEVKGNQSLAKIGPLEMKPRDMLPGIVKLQEEHIPPKYWDEMEGLAEGADLPLKDIQAANFIPELFHCSGFALMNSATADGTLYHGRVLDYGVDLKLQDHAVLIVAEPEGGIPFVNVTYAGFIGSVTGMNANHVSIGEMGGGGLGHWNGVPMAFLVRDVLETADDLAEAIGVFRDRPRSCEYYFVVADGKTNTAAGLEACWDRFGIVEPNTAHPRLPTPVEDAVLLSAGDRYSELVRRVQATHGKFTAESAIHLMDRPVAMKSNLHNVLFEPKSTRFWVANADSQGRPAAEQKYHAFQLTALLARQPGQ
ncbi:MAG: peptidase C45 [Pirellulales bacterium]|nr:peptidase C45 [Pirellulales bacterium]